jgi:hypothetical protein
VIAALLLLVPLCQNPAPAQDAAALEARAKAAFAALEPGERKELLDYVALELRAKNRLQDELLHRALQLDPREPAAFAEPVAAPFFDPATHAPAQPIARHSMGESDPALAAARKRLRSPDAPNALRSAWSYDYARREVLRLPGWDDATRVFANALAGYPPGADLAEALAEKALDDGAQQKAFAAFAHAYTDRRGNVYAGITLFDAYSSGKEFEMPDVDTLGLWHSLRDDWKTYVAPVRNPDPLYKALGQSFLVVSHHRGLRHALALCFLEAEPAIGTLGGQLANLQLAWFRAHGTPAELAPTLPAEAKWQAYFSALASAVQTDPEAFQAAELRRAALATAAKVVRETALAGLNEFHAYQKLDAAQPKDH